MPALTKLVNNRNMTLLSNLEHELDLNTNQSYLFDLKDYYGLLHVQGEKSSEFLQGQLSANIDNVSPNQIQQSAYCNLKGRVLALPDVCYWDDLYLLLPQDLIKPVQTSLAKTAVFSKVQINFEPTLHVFGLYTKDSQLDVPLSLPKNRNQATCNDDYFCYCAAPNLFIIISRKNNTSELTQSFQHHGQLRGSLAWHFLSLQHGLFEVYPNTRGAFLPHRLDLHQTGHLDFNKGCYKGQEIIARMHYRSKPKHTMKTMWLQSEEPLLAGKKIVAADSQQTIGELIDFCPASDNHYLIAASMLFEHPMQVLLEGHQAPSTLTPHDNNSA